MDPNSVYDVDQSELVEALAKELKSVQAIQAPKWAAFVKTGSFKERPPVREDWWQVRAASILRKIYFLGPIGVSNLRSHYGGKTGSSYQTEHFKKGSGNLIRKILQQLEKSGLIKQEAKGVHKGRIVTPQGRKLLSKVAASIAKPLPPRPQPAPRLEEPAQGQKDAAAPKVKREKKKPAKAKEPKHASASKTESPKTQSPTSPSLPSSTSASQTSPSSTLASQSPKSTPSRKESAESQSQKVESPQSEIQKG